MWKSGGESLTNSLCGVVFPAQQFPNTHSGVVAVQPALEPVCRPAEPRHTHPPLKTPGRVQVVDGASTDWLRLHDPVLGSVTLLEQLRDPGALTQESTGVPKDRTPEAAKGETLEVLPAFMEAAPTGPRWTRSLICCRLNSPLPGVAWRCSHPALSRLSRAPSNSQGRLHGTPQEGLRGWGTCSGRTPGPF